MILFWVMSSLLKRVRCLRKPNLRKLNHLVTLAGAALVFGWLPPDAARASLFAAGALLFAVVILSCVLRRRPVGRLLYGVHAREAVLPQSEMHVWLTWLLAIYGIGLVDVVFRNIAVTRTAILLLAVADAAGEFVGLRYGRRFYPAPDILYGTRHRRSLEGSTAVFLAGLGVMLTCVGTTPGAMLTSFAVAAAVCVCEAVSPRDCDNFTVPVLAGIMLTLCQYWELWA
jgi:dolichol kinase